MERHWEKLCPSIILVDLTAVATELNNDPRIWERFRPLPVLCLTAEDAAGRNEALAAGGEGCIVKPVLCAEVLDRVRTRLALNSTTGSP